MRPAARSDASRCADNLELFAAISPDTGTQHSQIGLTAREMIKLQHPTQGHVSNFNFVTLWHEGRLPGAFYKNVHVFRAASSTARPSAPARRP